MNDLRNRLLAAVMSKPLELSVGNSNSRCDGVTAFNSLQNSGVTASVSVTPELFHKISTVTPSHADSAD